jgi:hypothetical protein
VLTTLDTNVMVRLLIGNESQQTPIAEQAFLQVIANGGVYVPEARNQDGQTLAPLATTPNDLNPAHRR